MLRYVLLLSCAFLPAAAASAAEPTPILVEKEGYRFSYRSKLSADGLVRLRGLDLDTGRPFDLVVDRQGLVKGDVNGSRVRFTVPRATRDRIAARLTPAAPRGEALASADAATASGE